MSGKLNLDIQSILDKQFNIDFKGYSANEVDGFLDLVLEDYQTYQANASELDRKVQELERVNASLRAKLIESEGKARAAEEGQANNPNSLDIIKRISRLEQEVFNNKNQ